MGSLVPKEVGGVCSLDHRTSKAAKIAAMQTAARKRLAGFERNGGARVAGVRACKSTGALIVPPKGNGGSPG